MAQREYLTAVMIEGGVITLIEPNGQINCYRQRGLSRYTNQQINTLMQRNMLRSDVFNYKELPANYSISFEDEEIMGKARATFPKVNF